MLCAAWDEKSGDQAYRIVNMLDALAGDVADLQGHDRVAYPFADASRALADGNGGRRRSFPRGHGIHALPEALRNHADCRGLAFPERRVGADRRVQQTANPPSSAVTSSRWSARTAGCGQSHRRNR